MGADGNMQPVSAMTRFYIYGIQGFCDEIIFTSLFDFFHTGSMHLKGHSAISSFFIYGSCSFFVEQLYIFLWLKHGVKQHFRIPVYLLCVYTWEFTFGLILRQFNACPWDYSHYRYNLMGLITLEYAPGWLILSWLQDIIADYLLRLRVSPFPVPASSDECGSGKTYWNPTAGGSRKNTGEVLKELKNVGAGNSGPNGAQTVKPKNS